MRVDSDVIHNVANFYGLDFAKHIQALPFFTIPDRYKDEMFDGYTNTGSEYYTYSDEGLKFVKNGKIAICNPKVSSEILPFSEFVVWGDPFTYVVISRFVDNNTGLGGWILNLKLTNVLRLLGHTLPSHFNGCLVQVRISDMKNLGSVENMEMSKIETKYSIRCIESPRMKIDYAHINKTLTEHIGDNKDKASAMLSSILFLLTFFMWADSQHLVKVVGGNKKKAKKNESKLLKKPWMRNDLPHYIYLDSHIESTNGSTGTGHPLTVGYKRRSHWRTMTHHRFKNHPFYNIPMRIKEAWVGPKEWTTNNKTYTVHDKGKDNGDTKYR